MPKKTLIIAEAGVNHNGDINRAKELIYAANKAGADLIKFQTFKAERLVTNSLEKAQYQKENDKKSDTQFQMLNKLELSRDDHHNLNAICNQLDVDFFSSAFDIESLEFLNTLELEYIKIPSGEITNFPYLKFISKLQQKVILSTGMADLNEIENALNILTSDKLPLSKIFVLHCTTSYPTKLNEVNLKSMLRIKTEFNVQVGYSDHTEGLEASIAAVAMGATIIEKHFTLDKSLDGPDHKASLDPLEFQLLTKSIRNVEIALGNDLKQPTESELTNLSYARKFIVAKKNILKGEVFSDRNITTKRSGHGISAIEWPNIIGKKAFQNYKIDEVIL